MKAVSARRHCSMAPGSRVRRIIMCVRLVALLHDRSLSAHACSVVRVVIRSSPLCGPACHILWELICLSSCLVLAVLLGYRRHDFIIMHSVHEKYEPLVDARR